MNCPHCEKEIIKTDIPENELRRIAQQIQEYERALIRVRELLETLSLELERVKFFGDRVASKLAEDHFGEVCIVAKEANP